MTKLLNYLMRNSGKSLPFFSENLKAQIYLKQNNIDSAFVNAKKAFYGLPKNALHASTFAQVLALKKDLGEVKNTFKVLSKKSGPVIWKNFLIVCLNLYKVGKRLYKIFFPSV